MSARHSVLFGAGLIGLAMSSMAAADTYTCSSDSTDGPPTALFGGLESTTNGYGVGAARMAFPQRVAFDGSFTRQSAGGTVESVDLTGIIPNVLVGTVQRQLGSIEVTADVTAGFQGALSPDTHIVVRFSRPEVPQATFAAMVSLRAEFGDGSSSMLCMGPAATCHLAYATLSCQTVDLGPLGR